MIAMIVKKKIYAFANKVTSKLASLGFGSCAKGYQEFIKWRIRRNDAATLFPQYEDADLQSLIMSDNFTPPIWILWWQGIDQMPDVAKICLESVRRHAGQHPVRLITKRNYREYLGEAQWLKPMMLAVDEGRLLIAHLADMIRCYLLYTYGGTWIDATVLLATDIDRIVTNSIFVSGRREYEEGKKTFSSQAPARGKWTTYFIHSCKGNPLFKLLNEMLVRQMEENGFLPDYFMLDYSFITAWEHFPWVEKMVELSPSFPDNISALTGRLNDPADEVVFKALIAANPFLKLTYKHKWQEHTPCGELTYFGYLKRQYL